MPIRVTDLITTTDPTDTYATHSSTMGKGGLHEVSNIVERNAISPARRTSGMLAFVEDTGEYYTLGSDLLTWTELGVSVVTGTSVVYSPVLSSFQALVEELLLSATGELLATSAGAPLVGLAIPTTEVLVPNFMLSSTGDIIMGLES